MKITSDISMALANAKLAVAELNKRLGDLANALRKETDYPIWVKDRATAAHARNVTIAMYRNIEYMDEMKPQESAKLYGMIGVSLETVKLAEAVNDAKDEVARCFGVLKTAMNPEAELRSQKNYAMKRGRELYGGRFHYGQATRHIKILKENPVNISFTWLKTPEVICIPRGEVKRRLKKAAGANSPAGKRDMFRLEEVGRREWFSCANELTSPDAVMHVTWENGVRQTKQINMPIMIPMESPEPFGRFNPMRGIEDLQRHDKPRKRIIQEKPYFETIPVYRYEKHCRQMVMERQEEILRQKD